MNNTRIDIRFEGDKFLPSKLERKTGLPLEIIAEFGEVSKRGRYKGNPSPYGMALLKIEDVVNEDINPYLHRNLSRLVDHKNDFVEAGVEDIIIAIDAPISCDSEISLDKQSLDLITKLNATVDFNSYNDNEYDYLLQEIIKYIDEKIVANRDVKNQLKTKIESKWFHDFISTSFSKNNEVPNDKLAIGYLIMFLMKEMYASSTRPLSDTNNVLTSK